MKWHVQLSRYAMVGLASNAIGYLLYLLFTYTGMGHKTAMSLLYAVGVAQTFYFNRSWSFAHRGIVHRALTRYMIAYALGYLFNLALLWIAVDRLHLPHQGVQAVAVVVVAASLFFIQKYWVFAPTVMRSHAP
jgi:putative flippase GtrA